MLWLLVLAVVVVALLALALYDWTQEAHTIRRDFPLVGTSSSCWPARPGCR